jgi:hypothetical protein
MTFNCLAFLVSSFFLLDSSNLLSLSAFSFCLAISACLIFSFLTNSCLAKASSF